MRADSARAPRRPRSWETNSYGYHGDDGRKFAATPRGDAYGPTFTTGECSPNNHMRAAARPPRHLNPPRAPRHRR